MPKLLLFRLLKDINVRVVPREDFMNRSFDREHSRQSFMQGISREDIGKFAGRVALPDLGYRQ